MRTKIALVPLSLALLAPTAALAQQPAATPNFSGLFTSWGGISRESLRAETEARRPAPPPAGAVPAGSPLQGRSHSEAAALGERVAEFVRRGDCAEGERLAREAGDFPLVRAVRDHCRTSS
jgi:hypothetical protein